MAATAIGIALTMPVSRAQTSLPPQRTLQWEALARRIVSQLQLQPGEKVIALAQPGMFGELVPHLRYEVMKSGAVDLGVIEVIDEPYPEAWDPAVLRSGFAAARDGYVNLLRDVDATILLPGTNPVHPAYAALQMLLFKEGGRRRTIHFHWTDPYSSSGNEFGLMGVTILPGHSAPPLQVIDRVYQRAILETDLPALAAHQAAFSRAMRNAEVRITSPAGTNLRFRVGGRPIIEQNGDASARRMEAGAPFLVREVEIPSGAVRVSPLEETVNGVVVYPYSSWDGHTVVGARLTYRQGAIVAMDADSGAAHLRAELGRVPESTRRFREFGLGFNPLLAVPADNPSWIPYFGYGAGIVRLGVGNSMELGGAVTGPYFRWRDLLLDATVSLDGEVWVKDGAFIQ